MKCVYENPRLGLRIYEEPEHDGRVVEVRAATIEGRVFAPVDASQEVASLYRSIALQRAIESVDDDMERFGDVEYTESKSKMGVTLRQTGGDEILEAHHWLYARIKAWPPLASFDRPAPKTVEEIGEDFLGGRLN